MTRRAELLPVAKPHLDERDLASVREALESGWLSFGPKVKAFEAALAQWLGVPSSVATNSGTAALHLAVLAAGVGPGDEVLVPSLTFASTANVVVLEGATPVFVEVDPHTLCLDAEDAARKVTPRTRAMIPVHFAGISADLAALRVVCDRHDLVLIEDAAHAFGARHRGSLVGTEGDFTCFSFHATKCITTGEGGAVVARDPAALERVRALRWYGVDPATRPGGPMPAWTPFELSQPGFKYNMNDPQAALGLTQLDKAEALRARREALARRYRERLAHLGDRLALPSGATRPGDVHAWHLFVVQLPAGRRDAFMNALRSRLIATSVHYPLVHRLRFYRENHAAALPVTEALGDRICSLPMFAGMTEAEQDDVISAVEEALS